MTDTAKTTHPLQRSGISQPQRMLLAADPAAAPLENLSESQFLDYIWQLARTVVFHELRDDEIWKSDWQDFFSRSLPVQLALVGEFDLEKTRAEFDAAILNFESGLDRNNFEPLFGQVADLAFLLDRWLNVLPPDTPLHAELAGLLENDLRFALLRFFRLANDIESQLNGAFKKPKRLLDLTASPAWGLSPMDVFAAPAGPFARAKGSLSDKRQAWKTQIADLFQTFWQGLKRLKTLASDPVFREKSLDTTARHPAHIGLLLAFLRLLEEVQQKDLNGLTERHLSFFYREILGLKNLPARPDLAHLVVELDKNFPKTELKTTAHLKASEKDKFEADILFAPVEDSVLNQAQVAELRTIFRKTDGNAAFFAASAANSFDGLGLVFPEPDHAQWKTLGHPNATNGSPNAAPRLGFFVASPALLLHEGNAMVTMTLTFSGASAIPQQGDLADFFHIFYSGKKGWEDATDYELSPAQKFEATAAGQILTIKWAVPAGKPLEKADPALLGIDYGTTEPMVRLELAEAMPDLLFDFLTTTPLTEIEVSLVNIAVKNLLLSSDEGPLDPAKPFLPFGSMPKVGASLVIGSEEVFSKKLTGLTLEMAWDKLPAQTFSSYYDFYPSPDPENNSFRASFHFLEKGGWTQFSPSSDFLFGSTISPDLPSPFFSPVFNQTESEKLPETVVPLTAFNPLSADGFIKMSLATGDFQHDAYPKTLAAQMTTAPLLLPNLPYTPTLRELKLIYSATAKWSEDDLVFGHLHPFEPQNHEKRTKTDGASLLPAAHFFDKTALEGSLLIGLKNLVPGSLISLLFQVAEATAAPDVAIEKMRWECLADNRWLLLQPDLDIVEEATRSLTASGLVRLSLPFEISRKATTILPGGLHWLRVSVESGVAGVADTVGVFAQAVRATAIFQPKNDPARVAEPLPADSLGKLLVSDAAIKKIGQPFESFGGRPPETDAQFRRRTGERLRHKGRASTLFDYERMVLQQFPEIWKVKCLPHTRPLDDGSLLTVAPGWVTLAVIPDITRFLFSEKFRPRASRALLENIRNWLGERSSPFVRIEVVNPLFQPLDVQATVVFRKGKDRAFFKKKLDDDVQQFLTPWAFGEQDRLSFGGKMFQSSILHFVEGLDYVDYLTDFSLSEPGSPTPKAVVEARSERSILAFGSTNWLDPGLEICPPNPINAAQVGIGFGQIGDDFLIDE